MMTLTETIAAMKSKGYAVFETGNYNLNLAGLRSMPGRADEFDDILMCFYKVTGVWVCHAWPVTTDPGLYYLKNPTRVDGTAILCPGQYRGCWTFGLHKQTYEALVQGSYTGFKVWRDRDKDGQPDYSGDMYNDVQGLNCHKAGSDSPLVDKWSAGCQVFKRTKDFEAFMTICRKQRESGFGSKFTYTLMETPK